MLAPPFCTPGTDLSWIQVLRHNTCDSVVSVQLVYVQSTLRTQWFNELLTKSIILCLLQHELLWSWSLSEIMIYRVNPPAHLLTWERPWPETGLQLGVALAKRISMSPYLVYPVTYLTIVGFGGNALYGPGSPTVCILSGESQPKQWVYYSNLLAWPSESL